MILLNGEELLFNKFPNGETKMNEIQINLLYRRFGDEIDLKYEDDSDLIKMYFLKKYLDTKKAMNTTLTISYMPYSRMDRSENNSAFTLKYIADFINDLKFDSVTILEPHSDVTPALLNDSQSVFPTTGLLELAMDQFGFDKVRDYVFFPDGGAAKRYGKSVKGYKQLIGNKTRDFTTGQINGLEIIGNVESRGFKVIIVDDLCSRGGTFMLSAEKLQAIGATEIYLVVTHCESTIYDGDILKTDLINSVLTTDSIIYDSECDKITILNWRDFK